MADDGEARLILTVAHTKGGVGKTTLAFELALVRALADRDVWLVDADPQGSAMTAATVRAEAGRTPVLACSQYTTASTLGIQVRRQGAKYDDVVIDVGARDTETMRLALVLADTVLVPVVPRGLDVWALAQVSALVEIANALRGGLRALAVLNLADPGSSPDNVDAVAALAEFPALELIDAPIRRRKAFASAAAHGLAVGEFPPIDLKACSELSALARLVFNDDIERVEA
jgi:chromosome partitioning protein